MLTPPVSRYMTIAPATIAADAGLGEAVAAMRGTRIRHLPVLDGGRLVGLVSDRDLELLSSLRAEAVSPPALTVRDAMTTKIYTVREDAPLVDVVATMAERRLGSAIVTRGDRIVGIFTTVDALLALREQLDRPAG
jgi:acetoin utilization protein AcuB